MDGILACFRPARQVVHWASWPPTAPAARATAYTRTITDEEMRAVRRTEQKKAAFVGEYAAAGVFLDYPSLRSRTPPSRPGGGHKAADRRGRPEIVYTHNLATSTTRTSRWRCGRSPPSAGCRRKTAAASFTAARCGAVSTGWRTTTRWCSHSTSARTSPWRCVGVFDSQIAGGKRYDMATMGRRRANATYYESHAVDAGQSMNFAMDLTPLIQDDKLDANKYVQRYIEHLAQDVSQRIRRFS